MRHGPNRLFVRIFESLADREFRHDTNEETLVTEHDEVAMLKIPRWMQTARAADGASMPNGALGGDCKACDHDIRNPNTAVKNTVDQVYGPRGGVGEPKNPILIVPNISFPRQLRGV